MLSPSDYSFASAFDVVEKTIEVQVTINGDDERVRIDAVLGKEGSYSTRAYIEKYVTLQPTYPTGGDANIPDKETARQWVHFGLAWTRRASADAALAAALDHLSVAIRPKVG